MPGESGRERRSGFFRAEAVAAVREPRRATGNVMRVSPLWMSAVYWVVVACLMVALVVAGFGRLDDWSWGPAVVVADSKMVVSATAPGVVETVLVAPGEAVAQGQLLVQLNDDEERRESSRLDAEFEQQLARTLLDRSDVGARGTLVSLRSQRDQARARLATRRLAAPRAGRVADVLARAGQYIETGSLVVTLLEKEPRFRIVVLLPGSARPEVQPGMPLRVELVGYPYTYHDVRLAQVAEHVIGPAEARRFLGPQVADGVKVEGPVTLAQAELPSSFVAGGQARSFHDGMIGVGAIPLRQVRVGFLVAPWLARALLGAASP